MGLLKHKGQAKHKFFFAIHVHSLSWPLEDGSSLCVAYERGSSHSGSTRRAAPSPRRVPGGAVTFVFEEQLNLPVTLFQDAAAARKASSVRGLGPFLPKELLLAVHRTDGSGRPTGKPLGKVTLNLSDYAAADGRTQQAVTIGSAGGKLLLTIRCCDSSHAKGGAALSAGGSLSISSMGTEAEAEGLPTSMSTDEEGGSRATSRPGSALDSMAAVPEELPAELSLRQLPPDNWRQAQAGATAAGGGQQQQQTQQVQRSPAAPSPAAAAAAAAVAACEGRPGQQFDDDGFLVDEEPEASLKASAGVRRNLGSALEQAEASEAGSAAASEAQSRPGGGLEGRPSSGGAAGGAFARLRGGGASSRALGTPADALRAASQTPEPASTGQQSNLSAAGDPTVPFSVPPSTSRRFGQRELAAGGSSRRWAFRRDGSGAVAAGAAAAGASSFQRARLASAAHQPESPRSSDATSASGAVPSASAFAAAGATEAPAHSAGSSLGGVTSRHTTASEDHTAGGGAALAPANSAAGSHGAGISQFQLVAQAFGGPSSSSGGGAGGGAGGVDGPSGMPRARSSTGASGQLRTALSLLGGADSFALPSPDHRGSTALVLEALLRELRTTAALESAVYLAGGRKAFSGDPRHLHTPARRIARTVISLGPQEGLAFGLLAIQAIQATAGGAAGDMHMLTYWWSNVLQLRPLFWALFHGDSLAQPAAQAAQAAGRSGRWSSEVERQASEQLSPRAALAAAAAARTAAVSGPEWMQVLLPQLRDLEAWLFSEMLKHLWWRVLLQGVTALPPGRQAAASAAASPAAGPSLNGNSNGSMRGMASAKSAPHLGHTSSGASELNSPATRQGTPRSFESPEEEAVHQWVQGLLCVERALRDTSRPPPAPRQHLALLHRQLIVALLRRLDTLLFRKLLAEDGFDSSPSSHPLRLPSMSGRGAFERTVEADAVLGLGGAEAAAAGLLHPAVLPFQRGALTFSTGVHLKMAVSRLTGWAADCGVKEDRLVQAARSTEMSDYRLFPCLRATADLLMMPKEVLTDGEMRREVVPGLPLHRICQLLQRFEPDDCAPDPLPPGLLEALQSESPHSEGSTPSPTCKTGEEYVTPAEAALLADGVTEPVSLEMGEESEDELDSLAAVHSMHSSSPADLAPYYEGGAAPAGPAEELRASRFALLRDLWSATG